MSDYIILINILIKEEDEINNNNSNSYQQSTIFNEKQINLNGIKLFKNELKIPNKNKEQSIYKYDILFTNVLNCIDDYEKDSSFSDDMINITTPKKTINVEIQFNFVYIIFEMQDFFYEKIIILSNIILINKYICYILIRF